MNEAHSHCHRCGTKYERSGTASGWPRRCPINSGGCGHLQWFNPLCIQPQIGDPVFHGRGAPSVFDVPYLQRYLDEGIWEVLFEEGGMPVKIRHHEGGWKVAYRN